VKMDSSHQALRQLWYEWQLNRPSHQRLMIVFHNQVVSHHPAYRQYTLLDTLAVLGSGSPTPPHGAN